MKKIFRLLLIIALLICLFAPIYTNTSVSIDYREGQFVSLANFKAMVFDSPALSIAKIYFGEMSPNNYVFFFGGYPAENSLVSQYEIKTTWNPTGQNFIIWFIY